VSPDSVWRARARGASSQSAARAAPCGGAQRSRLDSHVGTGGSDLVFTSPAGEALHHGNFRKRVWLPALETVGLTNVHVHDLRHAGNVLVADAGANLRELMERMGHSTTRAALIYLHGGDGRQRALAAGVTDQVRAALQSEAKTRPLGSGTYDGRQTVRDPIDVTDMAVDLAIWVEPPVGIEPTTYSLRVNRSAD
jgi:hypothetical protein